MKNLNKFLSVALILSLLLLHGTFSAPKAEAAANEVYIGGQAFGVRFYSSGAVVVGLEPYFDGEKYVCPAKDGGLKENDVITAANGNEINTNEELKAAVENCGGKAVTLEIERSGNRETKTVTPCKNTVGVYLLGAWVRDSCAGIGTVTYYDADNNYFAALGHGICDADTGALLPLGSGDIVSARIGGVTKSVSGTAGSLSGYFTDVSIGTLSGNTQMGIYGTVDNTSVISGAKYQIADPSEVKTGKATLVTTVSGSTPAEYEIEIERIRNRSDTSNENFTLKITDERLIDSCGGIVQGMSGSPIVQNGKLVGAVTYVLVNSPCEGYGVFAMYMAQPDT